MLKSQLREDHQRWGDTWLNRPKAGQATRIKATFRNYFDQLERGNLSSAEEKIIWLKIMGNAVIALIRIMYPNMFPEKSNDELAPKSEK